MIMKILTFCIMTVVMLFSCQPKNANESIMVFAAAGLTNVLQELVDTFESNSNIEVALNLASSGTLARQMEQGMAVDVYISADQLWSDYVRDLDLVSQDKQQRIAGNGLVLITSRSNDWPTITIDSVMDLTSFLSDGRLAIGDPLHVPAGRYAKKALTYYGKFEDVEPHLLLCKDVRSVLMTVELQEVPLGIVYTTDALVSDKVRSLGAFDVRSYSAIPYVASLCHERRSAQLFYDFMISEKAKQILYSYGFLE